MRILKLATLGALTLTVTLSAPAFAQVELINLIRDGRSDAALQLVEEGDIDVNTTLADGSSALLYATYQVNHNLVRALLDADADPNTTNRFGSTPLTEAVKLADIAMVEMLLNAGADADSPNQDNQTALMLASQIGSLEIAQSLIEHGADVNAIETFRGQTALMWASGENHPDIAELLVNNGADVTVKAVHDDWGRQMTSEPRAQFLPTGGLTALLYAARSGCLRCAEVIVDAGADVDRPNPDGVTPLINALDNKSFDIAMFLIDEGADVNVWDMNGRTPIYVAVDMNSFRGGGFGFGRAVEPPPENVHTAMDVVTRLIDMGVDVNHQLTRIRPNGPGRGRFADYDMRGGVGPLFIASMNHDHEAMEILLANGAEADLENVFQMTPLMMAAGMTGTGRRRGPPLGEDIQSRAIKTIDLLLDAGAEVNRQIEDSYTFTAKLDTYVAGRDQEGRTALFAAAEAGHDQVVAHLLERGADPSITDDQGNTALDLAQEAATQSETENPAIPVLLEAMQ